MSRLATGRIVVDTDIMGVSTQLQCFQLALLNSRVQEIFPSVSGLKGSPYIITVGFFKAIYADPGGSRSQVKPPTRMMNVTQDNRKFVFLLVAFRFKGFKCFWVAQRLFACW
jgi:hypothetical protein